MKVPTAVFLACEFHAPVGTYSEHYSILYMSQCLPTNQFIDQLFTVFSALCDEEGGAKLSKCDVLPEL